MSYAYNCSKIKILLKTHDFPTRWTKNKEKEKKRKEKEVTKNWIFNQLYIWT